MYDDDENGGIGPTWQMEDIMGGSVFNETYQAASASALSTNLRASVEYGNKIIMPASALDTLSRLNIMYPMMFRVINESNMRSTFCGVLEFSAPEGVVYLSPWILKTLRMKIGDLVELTNVALPVGNFIKIQPQSVDFLDITDPRAVYQPSRLLIGFIKFYRLEHSLRNFATLTVGDLVTINYNTKSYEFLVQDVKPNDGRGGISVLETDLQVEFAPPVGYKEPQAKSKNEKSIASSFDIGAQLSTSVTSLASFAPFSGPVYRLSSKPKTLSNDNKQYGAGLTDDASTSLLSTNNSPAPLSLPKGTLFFGGSPMPTKDRDPSQDNTLPPPKFAPFSGKANKLQ